MSRISKTMGKRLFITLILSFSMIFTLIGCAGKKEEAPAKTDSEFNQAGLPIVTTPITLDVLTVRWGNMGDTFKANKWLQDLEKETNIKINWQVMSSNDWGEQKSIMLASGTLPDIIFGDNVFSDSDIVNNLSYFRPLDDYIENYMPNLKAAMLETPELKQISTFPDGKMYSLPARLPSRPITTMQPVINKAWLDRLGLAVPDNIEDLYNVFKAFKEKDPNQNGKADEIPFSGSVDISMDFLSPFGITDLNGNSMMLKNDEPVFYPASNEYKEALKWVHKLYSEGLIDQELFTQDNTMSTAKQQNPDAAIIGFSNQWIPDAVFGKWKDEYATIPSIAGPDGNRYQAGDPVGLSLRRNEFLITTFNKHPEISARWADQFYTNEASIQNFWGAIGTVIEEKEGGTYALMNPPEGTSADAWYWDQSLRDFGPKYVSPGFEKNIVLDETTGDGLKLVIDKLGREYVTTPFPNVMYTAEEFQELPTLTTDIDSYVKTNRAQWIIKGNIDQGWDAYIKQLNAMGMKRLLEIRTDAYERYTSVK
ncbi:ABC transporter substrate-binding protein [Paenibacillus sp. FSL H8-0548]|uniref:extracellular solute-binding protein n=2 Tax=Paenibacillus sp. FSL H8-0548 TaxID=1920422 RepID=UPI00096DEEB3|nr:extracellular solute-binding protein [Paenibacillus sp. FSL H8-0548]OMF37716.1 ABC transporter substrate-binding protein [Paenibacillus sp. FSL H8-0548]